MVGLEKYINYVAIAFAIIVVISGGYFIFSFGNRGISDNPYDWSNTGQFFSIFFTSLVSVLNLWVILKIHNSTVQFKLTKNRKEILEETIKELELIINPIVKNIYDNNFLDRYGKAHRDFLILNYRNGVCINVKENELNKFTSDIGDLYVQHLDYIEFRNTLIEKTAPSEIETGLSKEKQKLLLGTIKSIDDFFLSVIKSLNEKRNSILKETI